MIAQQIGAKAAPRNKRPPSLIGIWNWLGIISHGGWFVLMPCILEIPESWRLVILSTLAVPLLLGHLLFLHARIEKRRRQGR